MKNIKIILIGLVLLFSGCVETVEVPTPIPTSNALTEISNVSMNITFNCFEKTNDWIYLCNANYTSPNNMENNSNCVIIDSLGRFMNQTTVEINNRIISIEEITSVKKYDDYSVIEVLRSPKIDYWTIPSYNSTIIFENSGKCSIDEIKINYNIIRVVNGITVVNKSDIYFKHDFNYEQCKFNGAVVYNTEINNKIYNSMFICIDSIIYKTSKYDQYYTEILEKYR